MSVSAASLARVRLKVIPTVTATKATEGGATGGADNSTYMTPLRTKQQIDARLADQTTAEAGADNTELMTPLRTKQQADARLASQAEAEAGSNNTKTMTPLRVNQSIVANAKDGLLTGMLPFPDFVARTIQRTLGDIPVSAKEFGAVGDGTTDDTEALRKFFGADGPQHGHLPPGNYRITAYIRYSGANRIIEGSRSAGIVMDVSGTIDGGGIYRIQPCIIVDATADSSCLRGVTVNHNGADWPVYPASDFATDIFAPTNPPDPKGQAVMIMAHKFLLDDVAIFNAWDNGAGFGIYNETTGANEVGPDQCVANNCFTFNCGVGKHSWAVAPGVTSYNIGAGINFLHATNYVANGCRDFGSAYGFYADITGGNRGVLANCHSEAARMPVIWADDTAGGNQLWNQGGFGQTITGTSAGWLKTSGGVGFYCSSYGTALIGCTVDSPGMYGIVLEYQAIANQLVGCRVRNSGLAALVVNGKGHKITDFVVEGANLLLGTVAPSGSTYPSVMPAVLVSGMKESPSNIEIHTTAEFKGLVVKPSQEYAGVAPASVEYTYALHARTRNGIPCKVVIMTAGGEIVAGTSGDYLVDSGSCLDILQAGGDGNEGKFLHRHIGSGSALIELQNGSNGALQVAQEADGDVTVTNYATGRTMSTAQTGAGIQDWYVNGTQRFLLWGNSVRLPNLPTSASGLFSGDLWNDSGTLKIVP